MRIHPPSRALMAFCLLSFGLTAQPAGSAKGTPHLFFRVVLGGNFTESQSGRLLLFLAKGASANGVDTNPFAPQEVSVAAKEAYGLAPGAAIEIDAEDIAFPAGFSHLAPDSYSAQAVLDLRHEYNYVGRAPGNPISEVIPLSFRSRRNGRTCSDAQLDGSGAHSRRSRRRAHAERAHGKSIPAA